MAKKPINPMENLLEYQEQQADDQMDGTEESGEEESEDGEEANQETEQFEAEGNVSQKTDEETYEEDYEEPEPGSEYKENEEFYANLAEILPETSQDELAMDLLDAIDRDKDARALRDKQYEEGLKRTGLGNDAPGGAQFQGASRVVHPILTEVSVDFAARAIKELFPRSSAEGGPVKDRILGEVTEEKVAKAKRKSRYMNWQLTEQMPEFRNELEQLLTQVPLGGAQYMKLTWDKRLNRPRPYMVTIDDMYLPFAATSFYTAERKTHRQNVTRLEFDRRVNSGLYRDVGLLPSSPPEQTRASKANDKIEGREQHDYYDEDGLREIFEVYCEAEIHEDKLTKGEIAPYIITVDAQSKKILAIYRNWDSEDPRRVALDWIIEWPFVPWRGAYPIGMVHMIGGLSAAITGALRAILDSAHIQNSQTGLKLKGGSRGGQSLNIQPTQIIEVEGTPNNDDIRKTFMPLPFNGPSDTLYTLLGFLVDTAKGVVRTTFDDISDNPDRLPVGTTLALIEQGMVVFNAIHARLHDAMGRMLKVLHRLNYTYLDETVEVAELGELVVKRSDFEGPMDVIPVSDPNIFSEVQRFAQIQVIAERAAANPDLYDKRAVEELILKHTKIPDATALLLPPDEPPQPQKMNAVNENVAASMGSPVIAFPDQDHLAHIQVHLSYMINPMLGGSQIMAPVCIPPLLNHIKDHLALWYVNETVRVASIAAGRSIVDLMDPEDKDVDNEFDRMLAASDSVVEQQATAQLRDIPALIQQAVQILSQYSPQPTPDPTSVAMMSAQAQLQEAQRKAQYDQEKVDIERSKIASEALNKSKEIQARINMNREDNQTAMLISASELESGHKTNLRTGTGLGRG